MRRAVILLAVLSCLAVLGAVHASQAVPGGETCPKAFENLSTVMTPAIQAQVSPLACRILEVCRCRCLNQYHLCLRTGQSGCQQTFFDCDDACIEAHPEAAEQCTEPLNC